MKIRIYVRLLGEGTEVWRPVDARQQSSGVYRIVGTNPDPSDESWEFTTGDVVKCEDRLFSGGTRGLAAILKVEHGN